MSDHAKPRGNPDTERSTETEYVRWTDHSLDDMQQYFWRQIAPDAAADSPDHELLIVAPAAGWLRAGEVAALPVS